METCWAYSIVAFLGAATLTATVSPLSLFMTYWVALLVGRILPCLQLRWRALELLTVCIALLTLLVIVRVEVVGARVGGLDMTWLPGYVMSLLSLRESISGEFLTTAAVLYMFFRGLGLSQRPLTHWFIGFQFRLGIVAFFVVLVMSAMVAHYDATPAILIYFFLALLAIALARLDEMGSALALGPRWAVTLLAAVVMVIFLGLVLLQFFTLDAANALLVLLSPVFQVLGLLLFLLLIPAGILTEWLLNLLEPFLQGIRAPFDQVLRNLSRLAPAEQPQLAPQPNPYLDLFISAAKILLVATLMVGVGALLARALNRRMLQIEEETYRRESTGAEEEDSGRVHTSRRGKRAAPHRMGSIAAETIRRIYAALVARASDAGLPRRVAETPYEFLPRLMVAWPEEADDIQEITEAYIAVHYGEHAANVEEVGRVRAAWRRVQTGIRRHA